MYKVSENKNSVINIPGKRLEFFFGNRLYFFLALLISIPVFIAVNSYIESIHVHNDEAVSFASTVFFMLGIFTGRYIAQVWSATRTIYPKELITGLSAILLISTTWIFFHADFPLQHNRAALNLMLFWLPFSAISLSLGMLIKVVNAVTQNQLREAKGQVAHSKSELSLLQSQLSPHFLFNTLNNLYGLSLTQHEKIPALLLKLSELLRYSVYDASDTFVQLKDELLYLKNYMEFERIRIGERLVLSTNIELTEEQDVKIAPMLLIVFLENAFKHSKNTADDKIFIEVALKIWGNSILFSIKNSIGSEQAVNNVINKNSGFGLANVTKRLELLYPNEHELSIKQENNSYLVMLQLKLK